MHRRLNEIFESRLRKDYGQKVNLLAIILRVSGELQDFGSEGPERLYYRRQGRYLEIDLAIPRDAWEEQPPDPVRIYLTGGLRAAFKSLKERLNKVDAVADVDAWEADFEACLQQFAEENGRHEEPRKFVSAAGREAWRQRRRSS